MEPKKSLAHRGKGLFEFFEENPTEADRRFFGRETARKRS